VEASASDRIDELNRMVELLANRVSALERLAGIAPAGEPVAGVAIPVSGGERSPALLPVLGRCLLGLGGAYLLRALTAAGAVPAWAGVALGILYAVGWMVSSVRFSAEERLVAGLHITTAVLAISPMLWEATVVFHAVHNWVAAGLLAGFSLLGLELAWKRNLGVIAWITVMAGMMTAWALLLATRDLAPFTLALLVITAAVEFSACRDHWLGERWPVALFTDLAVLMMSWLATRPAGLPPGYAPVPGQLLFALPAGLLLVYLASMAVRTLRRGLDVRAFEILQLIAALSLLAAAVEWGGGGPLATLALGVVAILAGAGGYVAGFALLRRGARRNFYAYTSLGFALIAAGNLLVLPQLGRAAVWCLLGLAAVWLARRGQPPILRVHGLVFLALAAVETRLTAVVTAIVRPELPAPGDFGLLAPAALVVLWLGYGLLARRDETGTRMPAALTAGVAIWGACVVVACYLTHRPGLHVQAGWGGMILTTLLVFAATAAAWLGRRFSRQELAWLLWPTMVAAGYRLLAHDFRSGRPEMLSLELLLFGGALIAIPRIMRDPARAQGS